MDCLNLSQQLQKIKELKPQFEAAFKLAVAKTAQTVDIEKLKAAILLKKRLALRIREINRAINLLYVPLATNPYQEAMMAGGAKADMAPEKKEIEIDLKNEILRQIAVWQKHGLDEWAQEIEQSADQLLMRLFLAEKKEIIEKELNNGAIIVALPGKQTQINTTVDDIRTKFKPIFIKNRQKQTVDDAEIRDGSENYVINMIIERDESLTANVPDEPYLMLVRPSQAPEERTYGQDKNFVQQQAEMEKINQERAEAGMAEATAINLLEYLSLQVLFTETVEKQAENLGVSLIQLTPLDSLHSECIFTRFLNLAFDAPGGRFNPMMSFSSSKNQFRLSQWHVDAGSVFIGFRYTARVPLSISAKSAPASIWKNLKSKFKL